ncbi:MAG: hypothetical protein WAQ27_00865 [Candidatus Microsaccharimonas sp.]
MSDIISKSEDQNPSGEKYLDMLETALVEPQMDRVINSAKACNEMLDIVPVSTHEKAKIVNDLDAEWAPWMGERMIATGYIETKTGENEISRIFLDGKPVHAKGFDCTSTVVDKENDLHRGKVVYFLHARAQDITGDPNTTGIAAVRANLDELILESQTSSYERAVSWLEISSPDFIKEVDQRIVNATSETEALLGLRDFDIESFVELDDELTRNSVETYLAGLVQFDTLAPYDVLIDGRVYSVDENDEWAPEKMFDRRLAYPQTIRVALNEDQNKVGWQIVVTTMILPPDRRQQPTILQIPVDSYKFIASDRTTFHKNLE